MKSKNAILEIMNKDDITPSLGLCVIPNFRYSSKSSAQIYTAQYGAAGDLRDTPRWRPQNSGKIWNLLWLCRPLIICTEQTNIYINTFPNTLTS